MEIAFLPNGQECRIKEKIGDKYLVQRVFEAENEDGQYYDFVDTGLDLVDTVFSKPPRAKIDEKVKELKKLKKDLSRDVLHLGNEKAGLEYSIKKLTETAISETSFLIDKRKLIAAKRLVLFPESKIMPIEWNSKDKNFRGLRVSFEIRITEKEERSWGYKLYFDYGESGGEFLDKNNGILIDPTCEEVESAIKARAASKKFDKWALKNTPDEYLTPQQVTEKAEYKSADDAADRDRLTKEIETKTKELERLNSQLLPIQN